VSCPVSSRLATSQARSSRSRRSGSTSSTNFGSVGTQVLQQSQGSVAQGPATKVSWNCGADQCYITGHQPSLYIHCGMHLQAAQCTSFRMPETLVASQFAHQASALHSPVSTPGNWVRSLSAGPSLFSAAPESPSGRNTVEPTASDAGASLSGVAVSSPGLQPLGTMAVPQVEVGAEHGTLCTHSP
jgi:hypothetical protein